MEVELPGVDLARLAAHLRHALPDLTSGPLTGWRIPGGRSNLTYVITDGHGEWVLRRPPLGHVLATAHDMAREHRVITALAGTAVPVPTTLLLCQDPAVLGAPFYLMERAPGTVYRTAALSGAGANGGAGAEATDLAAAEVAELATEQVSYLARTLLDTLVALHRVDPDRVGLGDFGRPDGFLARQVRRWGRQLAASRSRDLPGIERLAGQLAESVPEPTGAALVHGDYRLDNVLVDDDRITAVLDWEMSTLGDPLTDLALLLVYQWYQPVPGFPDNATLTGWYAEQTGADLSRLDWYLALGCFKLATILEGIHFRYTQGMTVGAGFDRIGESVPPLVAHGLAALDRY